MVPANDVAALFDWAQRHALALFPIKAFNKQPRGIVASHTADCSKDPAQWRRWYDETRGCNFGVECGKSGIIVVDVDTDPVTWAPRFENRWATWANGDSFCVVSPSGGWHLYCRAPSEIDCCAMASPDWVKGQIDVQAGNKFVVAPWCETRKSHDPKVKRDGFYRIVRDRAELPLAPSDLLEHCRPVVAAPGSAPVGEEFREDGFPKTWSVRVNVEHRVNSLIRAFQDCPPKSRNDTLNETAFAFGRLVASGLLDRSAAEALLHAEGVAIGQSRNETVATVRSGMEAGIKAGPEALGMKIDELMGVGFPTQVRAEPVATAPVCGPAGEPLEPIVERLLVEGCVTVLSGASGSGKTTLGASLMAASAANLKNFMAPGLGPDLSDVLARSAAWVFVSYEGGQFMDLHRRAWHEGVGIPETNPERRVLINRRGALVFNDSKRNVVFNHVQWGELIAAVDEMRRRNPGLPVVVVVDNVTSAVEDPTDQTQAAAFMRAMRLLADAGVAVLLFAHPPKSGHSVVYGSHIFFSLADIVGYLEVVRKEGGEWVQWVDFEKHRLAPNGRALQLKSRKLPKPIIDLPPEWGGDPRGRDRALEDLRTPFIYQICVRWESERSVAETGGKRLDAVTPKEARVFQIPPNVGQRAAPPVGGASVHFLSAAHGSDFPPL